MTFTDFKTELLAALVTTSSALPKDALGLVIEPVLDCTHWSLQPKPAPGEHPCPTIARLHYYAGCDKILRCDRAQRPFKLKEYTISIFLDFTTRTEKAHAAFNDI